MLKVKNLPRINAYRSQAGEQNSWRLGHSPSKKRSHPGVATSSPGRRVLLCSLPLSEIHLSFFGAFFTWLGHEMVSLCFRLRLPRPFKVLAASLTIHHVRITRQLTTIQWKGLIIQIISCRQLSSKYVWLPVQPAVASGDIVSITWLSRTFT